MSRLYTGEPFRANWGLMVNPGTPVELKTRRPVTDEQYNALVRYAFGACAGAELLAAFPGYVATFGKTAPGFAATCAALSERDRSTIDAFACFVHHAEEPAAPNSKAEGNG